MFIRARHTLAAAVLLTAAPLHAQTSSPAPDTLVVTHPVVLVPASAAPAGPAHRNLLSVQPLSAMLTVYAGEFEHVMAPTWTLGVGANYWSPNDDYESLDYLSTELRGRYYPAGHALQGFSLGASAGVTHVKATDDAGSSSTTGATIGTTLEYGWLLGASRSFYVGLGAGAKSLFINDHDFGRSLTLHYPTARISVGWAF